MQCKICKVCFWNPVGLCLERKHVKKKKNCSVFHFYMLLTESQILLNTSPLRSPSFYWHVGGFSFIPVAVGIDNLMLSTMGYVCWCTFDTVVHSELHVT